MSHTGSAFPNDPTYAYPQVAEPAGTSSLGAIDVKGNNTQTLSPGEWSVTKLKTKGSATIEAPTATPANPVILYVSGEVNLGGSSEINPGGDPAAFIVIVTGTDDVELRGTTDFRGGIYAPESAVELHGNPLLVGSVVGATVDIIGSVDGTSDNGLCNVGGGACGTQGGDVDTDGVCTAVDNCPNDANNDQTDTDADGVGDVCDVCLNDPNNDADGDGVCGDVDNCPDDANPGQEDADSNGVGDACESDPCAAFGGDPDLDQVCTDSDNCPNDANQDQADGDADGVGDVCRRLPGGSRQRRRQRHCLW